MAIITDIQRFSVHDGPGIRTVIFLKGCPLHCMWCQNPETQNAFPELMVNPELCIGCGYCIKACQHDAVQNREKCISCGDCTINCYTKARKIAGQEKDVEEVAAYVMKDRIFFENSGGGVTASGGEATIHAEFVYDLFKIFKSEGLSTAIETSGYCMPDKIELIARECDLFLYDLKHMDSQKHLYYTGVDTDLIHNNLRALAAAGKRIIVRFPLIPGVNDSEENIRKTGAFSKELGIEEIHILPFHQFGEPKWSELSKQYRCHTWSPPAADKLSYAKQLLEEYVEHVNIGGGGELNGGKKCPE